MAKFLLPPDSGVGEAVLENLGRSNKVTLMKVPTVRDLIHNFTKKHRIPGKARKLKRLETGYIKSEVKCRYDPVDNSILYAEAFNDKSSLRIMLYGHFHKISRPKKIETIEHEFVHILQFLLTDMNKVHQASRENSPGYSYWNDPLEVEAHSREFFMHIKNQRKHGRMRTISEVMKFLKKKRMYKYSKHRDKMVKKIVSNLKLMQV